MKRKSEAAHGKPKAVSWCRQEEVSAAILDFPSSAPSWRGRNWTLVSCPAPPGCGIPPSMICHCWRPIQGWLFDPCAAGDLCQHSHYFSGIQGHAMPISPSHPIQLPPMLLEKFISQSIPIHINIISLKWKWKWTSAVPKLPRWDLSSSAADTWAPRWSPTFPCCSGTSAQVLWDRVTALPPPPSRHSLHVCLLLHLCWFHPCCCWSWFIARPALVLRHFWIFLGLSAWEILLPSLEPDPASLFPHLPSAPFFVFDTRLLTITEYHWWLLGLNIVFYLPALWQQFAEFRFLGGVYPVTDI